MHIDIDICKGSMPWSTFLFDFLNYYPARRPYVYVAVRNSRISPHACNPKTPMRVLELF